MAAAGWNPYRLPPQAPELAPLRDDLWRRLPHRQIPTVYPPLAVAAFSIAARLPFPILSWKLLVTAADLAACALLLRLARQLGLPLERTVWYAWNPLVALEVAGMGHVDILGVTAALSVVTCLLARRVPSEGNAPLLTSPRTQPPPSPGGGTYLPSGEAGGEERARTERNCLSLKGAFCPEAEFEHRPQPAPAPRRAGVIAAAGALAAFGVLAKLAPAAALPMWARQSGRAPLFLATALVLVTVAVLPVVAATGGVPPGLVTYGVTWDWNGPLFEPLWRLLAASGAAPALAGLLDRYKAWSEEWSRYNWIYPYLYPQLLAKLLLAGLSVAAVVRSTFERQPVAGSGRLFGSLLLFSATVYPWYLLWVLPWAALALHPAWLALSALVFLSYLAPALGVAPWPWIWLAVWGPFYLLLLGTWKRRPWSTA